MPADKPADSHDAARDRATAPHELVSASGRAFTVERGRDVRDPAVSVVVPIFNVQDTLGEALSSLTGQTWRDLEIVCVDDASTDASASMVRALAKRDGRVTVVSHHKNAGYGAGMNDGIQAASGAWIAILEPDDYVRPRMLEDLLAAARAAHGRVDVVKSPYVREIRTVEGTPRGKGPVTQIQCSYYGLVRPPRAGEPFVITDPGVDHLLRHHPSIWSALYRRAFLAERDIRFREYPGAAWADNEFFYETLLQARGIVWRGEPYYVYREETPEEARRFLRKNNRLAFERWHGMADIIERCGITEPRVLLAHVAKGFTFLRAQLDACGADDAQTLADADRMFARMDPALVAAEPSLDPALVELYARRSGNEVPVRRARHLAWLARTFWATTRANGLGYAMGRIRQTVGR